MFNLAKHSKLAYVYTLHFPRFSTNYNTSTLSLELAWGSKLYKLCPMWQDISPDEHTSIEISDVQTYYIFKSIKIMITLYIMKPKHRLIFWTCRKKFHFKYGNRNINHRIEFCTSGRFGTWKANMRPQFCMLHGLTKT